MLCCIPYCAQWYHAHIWALFTEHCWFRFNSNLGKFWIYFLTRASLFVIGRVLVCICILFLFWIFFLGSVWLSFTSAIKCLEWLLCVEWNVKLCSFTQLLTQSILRSISYFSARTVHFVSVSISRYVMHCIPSHYVCSWRQTLKITN